MTSLSNFSGQFKLYDNATDVTVGYGASYSVAHQEGCTVTIDEQTGEYHVSAVQNDNANAVFRAYYNGYELYKTFTISKARAVDGSSKYVELATSHYFFGYDANNQVVAQTTTLSLTNYNLTAAPQWRIKRVDDSVLAEGTAASLLADGSISGTANDNSIEIQAPLFDKLCRRAGASAIVIEAVVPNGAEVCSDRVTIYQMLRRARVAWENVDDPFGTKPDDNATEGAPPGTPVGDKTSDEVIDAITDLNGVLIRSEQIKADVDAAQAQIAEIESGFQEDLSDLNDEIDQLGDSVAGVATNVTGLLSTTSGIQQSVGALQSGLSGAQSSITGISNSVTTITGDLSDAVNRITNAEGEIDTISSTVGTHTSQISTNSTAISNVNGDLATLKTLVRVGGNLLRNTDFTTDTSGWSFNNTGLPGAEGGRDQSGDAWRLLNEHNISIKQPNATNNGAYAEYTQSVVVTGGHWYEFSVLVAAHRCKAEITLQWLDSTGGWINPPTPSQQITNYPAGGNFLAGWFHAGVKGQAPANAARAILYLRKLATDQGTTDSFAWFSRPLFAQTTAAAAYPSSYTSGNSGAAIETQAQAVRTLDGSLAALTTRVGTAESNVGQNAIAISTTQGNLANLTTTVNSQGGSITSLLSSVTTLSGTVSTLNTVVGASSSPNVLANGGFENALVGWSNSSSANIANAWFQATNAAWGTYVAHNTPWTGQSSATYGTFESDPIYGLDVGSYYTLTADADVRPNGQTGAQIGLQIKFITSGNPIFSNIPWYNLPAGGVSFDSNGTLRAALKNTVQVPAGTTGLTARLVTYAPQGVQINSMAWRQVKLERGQIATPYSGEATARQVYNAHSTLNSSFSSLSSTVSSLSGSVSTLQSSMTSAQGSISTLQTNVSSLNGSVSTLQQSSSTQAGQISSLQSTVNTQGASITSNSQAITSLQGSVATLNTTITASSSPNLLQNGGFENDLRGWDKVGLAQSGWWRNVWTWGNYAANTVSWSNGYCYLSSIPVGVAENNVYTFSAEAELRSNGAAYNYLSIAWENSAGQYISESNQNGPNQNQYFTSNGSSRFKVTATSPAGATAARLRLITYCPAGVTVTLISWRQAKFEFGSIATPYSAEASASQMFSAYSDLNSSHASLSSTVSSHTGSISTLQSTTSTLNGTVSSLSSTVSAQGSSISSLQSVQSTQSGTISTIQQRMTVGGNLLQNTEFAVGNEGWGIHSWDGNNANFTWARDGAGDSWRPLNEHNLSIHQADNNSGRISQWHSDQVAVTGGRWYEASALTASHRCYTHLQIGFYDANNNALPFTMSGRSDSFPGFYQSNGGQSVGNWQRLWVKAQAPSNATRALIVFLKLGTSQDNQWNGSTDSWGWMARPQIAEVFAETQGPTSYFPGRTSASINIQQNSINTLNGQYSSLSSTVSTQGASISSLQSTTSTLQGDTATLKTQVSAGNPNLIKNGGFELGNLNYWTPVGASFNAYGGTDTWGTYAVNGSNVPDGSYTYIESNKVNIEADYYTASADIGYFGSGSGHAYVELVFWNNDTYVTQVGGTARSIGFNFSSDGYTRRLTKVTGLAPSNANRVSCRVVWYKANGTAQSMHVRQVKLERGQVATPYSAEATIRQTFEALSTLNSQYASLTSTVSTLNSSVTTQQAAINNLNGRTAAWIEMTAVAGNGRAQLRLVADANGGGGVDIVGDLRVTGNALIGGTVNPEALALDRFVKRIYNSGAGSAARGQTLLIYAQDLGYTMANGSYLLEFNGGFQTTVGNYIGSHNNKPYSRVDTADGGIRLALSKNGSEFWMTVISANEWQQINAVNLRTYSTTRTFVIDSPGGSDGGAGNVVVTAHAIQGASDTGIVDDGDNYRQIRSADYTGCSFNLKTKWTWI